jgi:hypothetical protein
MGRERRRQLLLTGLVLLLGVAAYRFWPRTAPGAPPPANARGTARAATGEGEVLAPDVRLESLSRPRPKPGDADRNLFRFKPRTTPTAAQPVGSRQGPPPASMSNGPPSTPQVSQIPLKFIGILEVPGQSQRMAVLSDPRGVYHGREGDIIEGRYRILRIGSESIELAHLDGRTRQTLRLSGQ